MNTIQYSPEAVRYMQQVFPWATRVVNANGISITSAVFAGLTRWQTDRPRYAVGNNSLGGTHCRETEFCYCLRLQQVFIGTVDLNTPNFIRYMQQVFPWATRVVNANGISITSAVFAGLTRWQTDRPRYAVGNNSLGGAHCRETEFCYCLRLQQVFIGTVDSNTPNFIRKF